MLLTSSITAVGTLDKPRLIAQTLPVPIVGYTLLAAVKFSKMDKEELEFDNRKKKIEAFKTELKALMNKYNFGKDESDQYNGMEEYCGTDYYFTIDGETWYSETIAEILDDIIGSH